MKKGLVIALIIILLIIIIGFVIGGLYKNTRACTLLGCLCPEGESEEIKCNSCSSIDPIFITGIINAAKVCGANEILVCENRVVKDKRYDVNYPQAKARGVHR